MNSRFPLYLSNKRQGVLVLPCPLTEAELAQLEEQVNNAFWVAKEAFVERDAAADAEQPAAAQESSKETEGKHE